ncbi:CPBP family glutamic-type intramembrane protease [Actinoplanes sp. CA-142083]|uniref:CPBP family glutamic-type intramembrane protease n=1 Tax=Actinoplanes sp. CA-142083 TaxID=3239903 RepID=UPI003D8FA4AB
MRLVEYLLIFFGLVGVYIAVHVPGGPIPVLLVAAVAIVFYLRRATGFDRANFWRRGSLRGVLLLWAAVTVLTVAAVAIFDRDMLFDLPRREPLLWLAIIVFYPLVSVYPQELLFRAFLLHRYSPVFGFHRAAAAASAAAFGFAHLLFGNVIAVVATVVGGWLFARRYQRTQSLLVVSIEHALYGITIFTVGLGQYFYHGSSL